MMSRMLATKIGMFLAPLCECGDDDAVTAHQPVHQVFAQRSAVERYLRRADEAYVRPWHALVGAQRPQVVLPLEDIEEEHLRLGGQRLHFVEEERAVIGLEE